MSTSLLGLDDVSFKIATFLTSRETLDLFAVSRGWRDVLARHEDGLFEIHLKRDFVEGAVLCYVAEEREVRRKQLYLGFLKRWSLAAQGDESERVCVTWTRPVSLLPDVDYDSPERNEDVRSLAFVARVGSTNDPNSCALLRWDPDFDSSSNVGGLSVDARWSETTGGLTVGQNLDANQLLLDDDFDVEEDLLDLEDKLAGSHTLTLHAIDVQHCHVATLMEYNEMRSICTGTNSEEADFVAVGYGHDLPKLYGVPPKGSPYYRDLTENDFREDFTDHDGDEYPPFEVMPIEGMLQLHGTDDGDGFSLSLHQDKIGLTFTGDEFVESTVSRPSQVCSFLKTLMVEKCFRSGSTKQEPQPDWVQTEKIIDAIISFASFEDQAGKLRLVCRHFGASALRSLERKLDETKVIGFQRGEMWDFFKAKVHLGWSDKILTSRESAIEDALWLVSCRCRLRLCPDKETCPHRGVSPRYNAADENTTKKLDVEWARGQLISKGRFSLGTSGECRCYEDDCCGCHNCECRCSFDQEQMSIYQVCEKIVHIVQSKVSYAHEEYAVQRYYGVSRGIPSRQFIRSLFLVFTKPPLAKEDAEQIVHKKPRQVRNDEVSIGMATALTRLHDDHYSRMLTTFRFYSAAHERIEISMEHYGGI
ncbi:hypothetical protein ACHAWF_004894 [Thalassiosira exigua]